MYGAPKKPISNVQKVPKSNIPMYNNILFGGCANNPNIPTLKKAISQYPNTQKSNIPISQHSKNQYPNIPIYGEWG